MAQSATVDPTISALLAMMKDQMYQNRELLLAVQQSGSGTRTTGAHGDTTRTSDKPINSKDAPRLLAGSTLNDFTRWLERWEDYVVCQHLNAQSREAQVAALRVCFDDDLLRFVRQGVIVVNSTATVTEYITSIKEYIRAQQNPLLDRIKFFQRTQEVGESFDEFYASVKELQVSCDFSSDDTCDTCVRRHAESLRDKVIVGVSDQDTRHKLLACKKPTLDEVVNMARAEEAAKCSQNDLNSGTSVNAVSKMTAYKKQQKHTPTQLTHSDKKCTKCGRAWHADIADCPATNIVCLKCNKKGHFAKWCKSKECGIKSIQAGLVQVQGCFSSDQRIDTKIESDSNICGQVKFRDDTGSDIDTIGVNELHALGGSSEDLRPVQMPVFSADHSKLEVVGKVPVRISANNTTTHSELYVIQGVQQPLLSKQSLKALGYLPKDWPNGIDSHMSVNNTSLSPEVLREQLLREYQDVFDMSNLKTMFTEPVHIVLKEGAVPFCLNSARPVPFAYRDQVKSQLDDMVAQQIIEPVSEPSEWCHPIVLADKKGTTEKRVTVDMTMLNKQVQRKVHHSNSPKDVLNTMTASTIFTTMDAYKGYWQVPLTEESKRLTTFITPWGRFRFLRNTMGYVSGGDEYNERMDQAIGAIANIGKVVDDVIVYDRSIEEHAARLREILDKCREFGITLSSRKFVVAKSEVVFCGYNVSKDGWRVDDSKVSTIRNFPRPQNRTDLRSFFGLLQQFASFSPHISKLSEPLRANLKEKHLFQWDANHDTAFEAVKAELVKSPVLTCFDPSLPLRLETDASRVGGLGFVLLQNEHDSWKLVQCGSRFLSDAESRYAMIELELLAVAWAVSKCSLYLSGREFELITDHRPLIPILNTYSLNQIENERLLRLRLKLQNYVFVAQWRKGKDNVSADALSRSPVHDAKAEDELAESDVPTTCNALSTFDQMQAAQIRDAAVNDIEYITLIETVISGFPKSQSDLPTCLMPYWTSQMELSVFEGIVCKGARIVIPRSIRQKVLHYLHSSHQGIERTKQRARQIAFWPGMNREIENIVRTCTKCCTYKPSQPSEPLVQAEIPELPFSSTCTTDLFSCGGKQWLVYADITSGWTSVGNMGRSASSLSVVDTLRSWFTDVGVPSTITSDGGPQFGSRKFREFCEEWGITHNMSTPHYPRSNGRAEAAVKCVKSLLIKTATLRGFDLTAFHRGLLELRNTPTIGGLSPAQILYGRPLKSFVFASMKSFADQWQKPLAAAQNDASQRRLKSKIVP